MAEVVSAARRFRPGFVVLLVGPVSLFTHGCGALHCRSGGGVGPNGDEAGAGGGLASINE